MDMLRYENHALVNRESELRGFLKPHAVFLLRLGFYLRQMGGLQAAGAPAARHVYFGEGERPFRECGIGVDERDYLTASGLPQWLPTRPGVADDDPSNVDSALSPFRLKPNTDFDFG